MKAQSFIVRSLVILLVIACGAKTQDADSQGHWLKACSEQAQCGSATCLCGVCTSECNTDADCWERGNGMGARCELVSVEGCSALSVGANICVPDCPGGDCISVDTSATTSSETADVASELQFKEFSVPRCPAVSGTVSLPLASVTAASDYDGVVSVEAIADDSFGQRVTLVFNERVGESASVLFRGVDHGLASGQRLTALIRGGGTDSAAYAFAALRDETGKLLAAVASGRDTLYQQGLFAEGSPFGASVIMRMKCQESVDDGCFTDQIQADYDIEFHADATVVTDGSAYQPVSIAGEPFLLSAWGSSVDGQEPLCPNASTGRYLQFALIAE